MMIRTHLAISVLAVILMISSVEHKIIFFLGVLIATFIPDIDSASSKLGRKKIFGPLHLFSKHRGFFHSFTFLFFVTFLIVIFYPVAALPFFIGYGLHLLADSFTVEGINPIYPSKKHLCGNIRTGSKFESSIFYFVIVLCLVFLLFKIPYIVQQF